MLLQKICIVLGIVIIVGRLPGVFWPEKIRGFVGKWANMPAGIMKVIGVVAVAAGLFFIYAVFREVETIKLVVSLLGALFIAGGFLYFSRDVVRSLAENLITKRSPVMIQILSGIGTAVGLALLLLGIFSKGS